MTKEEAKVVIQKLRSCIEHDTCENIDCAYFGMLNELDTLLEYVENAEPIIRCKDCKWYNSGKNGVDAWHQCGMGKKNMSTFDVFYCFSGERKSDDGQQSVQTDF